MERAIAWASAHLTNDAARSAGELCLAAMIAGAAGDGVGAEERAYVLETAPLLPGFSQIPKEELAALVDKAIAALTGTDVRAGLAALSASATSEQRRAAYALACLAAMADGVASDAELDQLLDVRDGLGVPDGEAADIEASVRASVGAEEFLDKEDSLSWRLAQPEVLDRAAGFASRSVNPTPLAPYADACIEAMLLAAAADGSLDEVEADHIFELAERLPALGGIDGHELERFVGDAAARITREGAERRLRALGGWLPPDARRGVFTLAAVVALADRRATEEELVLLDRMRRQFGISEADGDEIVDAIREEIYA